MSSKKIVIFCMQKRDWNFLELRVQRDQLMKGMYKEFKGLGGGRGS